MSSIHKIRKTQPSETSVQIAVMDWVRAQGESVSNYVFHIANESPRTVIYGALLKKMGMRAGVSDLFIAIPTQKYHGAWIEIKQGKNKLTKSQKYFLESMSKKDYYTAVTYGVDETIKVINNYLRNKS